MTPALTAALLSTAARASHRPIWRHAATKLTLPRRNKAGFPLYTVLPSISGSHVLHGGRGIYDDAAVYTEKSAVMIIAAAEASSKRSGSLQRSCRVVQDDGEISCRLILLHAEVAAATELENKALLM